MKNYLAAIRYAQISLGLGDPQLTIMPRLEYVVKGFEECYLLSKSHSTTYHTRPSLSYEKGLARMEESPGRINVVGYRGHVFLRLPEMW